MEPIPSLQPSELGVVSLPQRGLDVIGSLLGVRPKERVRSAQQREQTILNLLTDPRKTPSLLQLQERSRQWINSNISVHKKPGDSDEAFARAEEEKRQEYIQEVEQLLSLKRAEWERAVVTAKNQHHAFVTKSYPIPQEREPEYTIEERLLTPPDPKTGQPGDILQFISAHDLDPNTKESVVQAAQKTWQLFRDKHIDPQRHIVGFIARNSRGASHLRSHVLSLPGREPDVVLELDQPDVEGATVHEEIHQVFTAQGGPSFVPDVFEGIATRLGFSLTGKSPESGNDVRKNPEFLVIRSIDWKKVGAVGSHTQVLKTFEHQQAQKIGSQKESLPYIYGFALADVILKSRRFREDSEAARQAGENPYRLLLKIHAATAPEELIADGWLSEKNGKYFAKRPLKQRELLAHALQKNGLIPNEIFQSVALTMLHLQQGGAI